MAGYKDFSDGSVLTAAEVDGFLMRQTVMRFATTAARDTALSGVVEDGMLAYTDDTGKVWVRVPGTWVPLSGASTTFPYAAGVTNLGGAYGTPTVYTSKALSRVHIEAVLTRTSNSASQVVHVCGTLAAGSRPARDIMFPIHTDIGGEKTVRGVIATAGVISMILPAAAIWATTNFVGFTADFVLP